MKRKVLIFKDANSESFYAEADLALPSAYVLHVSPRGSEKIYNFNDLSSLPDEAADAFREWMDIIFNQ